MEEIVHFAARSHRNSQALPATGRMIAPYHFPYAPTDLWAALCGLRRPFPEVGTDWFRAFKGLDMEVFPTNRGREGQYALLRALGLPLQARVGVPLLTHPVVWQTVAAAGMKPVFLDADPITFGLNLEDLQKKRDRLNCLILVHSFGYPADFDVIAEIMQGKPILEDCAHTLGSTYRGRPLGSLGDGSFFTFLFSKPLSAGGGGCAATRHRTVARAVRKQLREGAEESVPQGIYHIAETLALALAYKKNFYSIMTRLTHIPVYRRAARKRINYVSPLLHMRRSDWGVVASRARTWNPDSHKNSNFWADVRSHVPDGWHIPAEPQHGDWNHWLLPVRPYSEEASVRSIAQLRSRGVSAGLIYDDSPEAAYPYGYSGDCPQAERLARSVFLLPAHSRLTASERDHILGCVRLLREQDKTSSRYRRSPARGEHIATAGL
jgi:perosamine synthetase